uniref:Nuclear-interacting partner of ALK isoform 2 n=1 Tax=Sus scrofa TaxID=9823 RepID=A0A480PJN7_PIG
MLSREITGLIVFRKSKIQCAVTDDMMCREARYKIVRQSDALKGLPVVLPLCFRKDTSATFQPVNGSPQAEEPPLESTSKEAFFSRVETFSSLKWAGKPPELSPLVCAKYGWVTVECDMLKCSSCQAFLCATLQPAFDFDRYKERCAELKKALCTAHEKFCFWPDSPSPDRFGMLPLDEPGVLVSEFLDRFQSLCHLDLQLPSLRPEDLKTMCLTEDKITLLLHLLEDELDHRTDERKTAIKLGSDIQVHVTACILSVCGWACSSALEPVQLSLITCSQCMRKVGLWGFQQMESLADLDASFGLTSSPVPGSEGRPERFPLVPESPRRMMTRSQDATFSPGSEQAERSPGPIVTRTRSWDSSSPIDRPEPEAASPTTRTRPVTRSMGTGDTAGLEVPSSPLRRAKRARLCSSSSSVCAPACVEVPEHSRTPGEAGMSQSCGSEEAMGISLRMGQLGGVPRWPSG